MEEWRAIRDYEGLYEVSSCGRVRSLDRIDSLGHKRKGKVLKQSKIRDYLQVILCKDGEHKRFSIHRLVLMTFRPIDNMENLQVNHIDEDKSNNNLSNLEWCDSEYNCNYGTRNERIRIAMTNKDYASAKPIYCIELDAYYRSINEASRELGIDDSSIGKVCKGKRKSCGGYHFIYVD